MPVSQQFGSNPVAANPSTTISSSRERRRAQRDGIHGEPDRQQLVSLILSTYAEMPGLSLNLRQAARLFGLREATCRVVLNALVRDGRLRQSADHQYRALGSVRG
jgi:hypothetical protein